jgi:hypothetical protein
MTFIVRSRGLDQTLHVTVIKALITPSPRDVLICHTYESNLRNAFSRRAPYLLLWTQQALNIKVLYVRLFPKSRSVQNSHMFVCLWRMPREKGKKGKAVPLQAWSGPGGSSTLRFPDFMKTAQDGGKVVSLTHRPPLPPRKYTWYSFLLEAESTPGP